MYSKCGKNYYGKLRELVLCDDDRRCLIIFSNHFCSRPSNNLVSNASDRIENWNIMEYAKWFMGVNKLHNPWRNFLSNTILFLKLSNFWIDAELIFLFKFPQNPPFWSRLMKKRIANARDANILSKMII